MGVYLLKTVFKRKNKIRGITLPNEVSRLTAELQCSRLCGVCRKINQWNRMKNLEIVPHKIFPSDFDKEVKPIQ